MAKKKAELKNAPNIYEKSNLVIKGTFDEAVSLFFVNPKKPVHLVQKKDNN